MAQTISYPAVTRDPYGAVPRRAVPQEIATLVEEVRAEAGWTKGIEWTHKRRGFYDAQSIDVYGYALAPQLLAVIQIRRTTRHRYGQDVRKSYALVGRDEGDQVFSHPLPSSPRRMRDLDAATPEDVVAWAESKIFGVPVSQLGSVIRQGDIAIIPVRAIPATADPIAESESLHTWTFAGSHEVVVDGDIWDHPGGLYARGLVEISHGPGQHAAVSFEGRCRIVVGSRGDSPWWLDADLVLGD
jgi:hypothetical protein